MLPDRGRRGKGDRYRRSADAGKRRCQKLPQKRLFMRQNGDQIDVTIITSRDEVNLPRLLESGLYSFVNISKTVNPADQSVIQSVKLRSSLP